MVTSDFKPEVEIRPFRACAMKNTQYNAYLWPNRRSSRVLKKIGVEEHDGDVRLQTGSGNIALSFLRHASRHNYRNSSFIVDEAMGQISRCTERVSSCSDYCLFRFARCYFFIFICVRMRRRYLTFKTFPEVIYRTPKGRGATRPALL